MIILKQSTAIKVRVGPFVDVGDGFTPETGITLSGADEAELLKANGAATVDISGATWAAVTGADGWYDLSLTTGHTDTIGELVVVVQDDSVCLPVFKTFQVVEEAVYDDLFASGSDPFTTMQSNVSAILTDTAEIGAAGAGLTEAGGTGDQLSAIPWNAAWDAEVESEVNDALDTAISELGVAAPAATPTIRTAIMLMYMALRNKLVVQTSGTDAIEVYNDAGTKIASKAITDDGSDYTEAEMA